MPVPERHDAEIVECILTPAQETIPLAVTFEFQFLVFRRRVSGAEHIDLDRVVDHQIDRHQRVHLRRIAAKPDDAVAHGGEVDHRRHPGKILHQNAGGLEWDFFR